MADEDPPQLTKRKVSMMVVNKERSKSVGNFAASGRQVSRLKVRKQSYGFGSIAGIRVLNKSQGGIEYRRPPQTYLNTYQLKPKDPFDIVFATDVVNTSLDMAFTGHIYNPQSSPNMALKLSVELLRKFKNMFSRYRVLSIVTLGQRRAQSYGNAVAFLWDHTTDNYVNVYRNTHTAFIQVLELCEGPVNI